MVTNANLDRHAQPLVSIGMPTYNRPERLRAALAGIVSQTYRNLEIIVADNGSPGGDTEEVVREFIRVDSRIQYYKHPENLGAAFNFQFVLDKATGEYFMWAADDDWRDRDYIATLLEMMVACPDSAIGFCDFNELDINGHKYHGYPDHHDLLTPFTTPIRWLRLWRYFMQYESLGKANMIYGIMRRKYLEGFSWDRFTEEQGRLSFGLDMLFVYRMLGFGQLVLSNKKLYGCTVGNVKEYEFSTNNDHASYDRNYIGDVMKYSLRYIALSDGLTCSMIALSLPLKIIKNMMMLRNRMSNVIKSAIFTKLK